MASGYPRGYPPPTEYGYEDEQQAGAQPPPPFRGPPYAPYQMQPSYSHPPGPYYGFPPAMAPPSVPSAHYARPPPLQEGKAPGGQVSACPSASESAFAQARPPGLLTPSAPPVEEDERELKGDQETTDRNLLKVLRKAQKYQRLLGVTGQFGQSSYGQMKPFSGYAQGGHYGHQGAFGGLGSHGVPLTGAAGKYDKYMYLAGLLLKKNGLGGKPQYQQYSNHYNANPNKYPAALLTQFLQKHSGNTNQSPSGYPGHHRSLDSSQGKNATREEERFDFSSSDEEE